MTQDLTPLPEDPIDRFIEKLNLPTIIAGPAGKAISRLVAGVIDIPAAYLDSFAQSIKDKTAARSTVHQEVSVAAARLAAGDTDIVARAAHNLLAKEYRRQKNKEDVARKTIELLEVDTEKNGGAEAKPSKPPPDVDNDWLNVFEKYAEDASTERMQTLWARVLAGEIRRPQSFSLKTLRFLAEVDQKTAKLFQKHASCVANGDFIPCPPKQGPEFSELLTLENAGLISGTHGQLHQTFTIPEEFTSLPLLFGQEMLVVGFNRAIDVRLPVVLLTDTAQEILSITDLQPNIGKMREVADKFPKDHVMTINHISTHTIPPTKTVLWEKPAEPEASESPNQHRP